MTPSNTHWGGLYKIAGISALILLVYSLVTMALLIVAGPLYLVWIPLPARDFSRLAKVKP